MGLGLRITTSISGAFRAAPVFALSTLLGLTSCGESRARRAGPVPVVVAAVEQRPVPHEIEATGTAEPAQSADVTSQVGGLVTKVGFREGQEVNAGQLLFQIDPGPYEAAVTRAAAVLSRSRAQAEAARLDLERAQALQEQQLISAGEFERKSADTEALRATVRADSAAWLAARLDLENAAVRAPLAGRTGSQTVHVGGLVRENAGVLVTIHRLRPMLVRFTVPQSDLAAIRAQQGRGLRVDAEPAEGDSSSVTGKLVFVDNQVDEGSGTVMLKAEFPNRDGRLWPGAFARVRLRLYEQDRAIVVPSLAVANSQQGTYLYVMKPDTTVEARPVVVERTWRDLSVISSGVEVGEVVVTDGQMRLSPGARAVVRQAAAASPETSR